MPTLNLITALFVMAAFYGSGRRRFQLFIGMAALVSAPTLMGVFHGMPGLVFSLAGAGAALLLTAPLCIFRRVSWPDVIVSVALGGVLGAVQYAVVFAVAIAFLALQRILGIEGSPAASEETAVESMVSASPYGAGLLAFDEKSALVEIEAMKMLHMDRKEQLQPLHFEELANGARGVSSRGTASLFPWCAKLAVATLAVLMIGSTM